MLECDVGVGDMRVGMIGFGWTGCDGALVLSITVLSITVSMAFIVPLPTLTLTSSLVG